MGSQVPGAGVTAKGEGQLFGEMECPKVLRPTPLTTENTKACRRESTCIGPWWRSPKGPVRILALSAHSDRSLRAAQPSCLPRIHIKHQTQVGPSQNQILEAIPGITGPGDPMGAALSPSRDPLSVNRPFPSRSSQLGSPRLSLPISLNRSLTALSHQIQEAAGGGGCAVPA